MTNESKYFTHRSGIETDWRCPRAGYLEYHHLGTGITRDPRPVYLDIGIACHIGLAGMIGGETPAHAIQEALDYFDGSCQKAHLKNIAFREARLTVECLLWTFAVYTLPSFLKVYKVLWVEREVVQSIRRGDRPNVVIQSRPDAVVLDTLSNECAVISWKTIDSVTDWRRLFHKHDLQGLMEMSYAELDMVEVKTQALQRLKSGIDTSLPIEQQLKDLEQSIAHYRSIPEQVDYVQTIYLQKGKRERLAGEGGEVNDWDADVFEDGDYRLNSFLVNPWVNVNDAQLSWSWRYHKPGNSTFSTIGKDFKRTLLELVPGFSDVETWIRALNENLIFPSSMDESKKDPLKSVVVWEEPSYRNRQLMPRIMRQVEIAESNRADRVMRIQNYVREHGMSSSDFDDFLDELFPQRLTSCNHPWRCQFQAVCYGPAPVWSKIPEGFTTRIPHHEPELQYLAEQGLIKIEGL